MGLMRRVEPDIEPDPDGRRVVRPVPPEGKRRGALAVQPKELAQKLIKELEDHKIVRREGAMVSNRFIVYLCPSDYDRFAPQMATLVDKLTRALAKHVRSKRYQPSGPLEVLVEREPDLRIGYFGILAERVAESPVSPRLGPQRVETQRETVVIPDGRGPRPAEAVDRVLVLRAGGRSREFNGGRIIIGRARDADFQLDDPNVSRRHAALSWDGSRVLVEDLGSTNGTIVNGYPVSSALLRPTDVVVVGDTRLDVEIRSR